MGLQKANLTYTDIFGNTVERTLTIKDVVFKYEDAQIEVIYRSSPTDVSKAALADSTFISHSINVDMTNPADVSLILSASDRIWELVATAPLIDVPELDEERNRIVVRKSITELGGIVDALK